MRELHVFDTVDPRRGDQIVAHDVYVRFWGLGVPDRFILGRCASVVVDGEDLG